MIRNKLPLLIVLLFCVNRATAYAAPEYSLSQEDTLEGSYYTLTYTESYNGTITDDDLEKNLEYEGQQYQLVSADIEYRYSPKGKQNAEKSKTKIIQLNTDEITQIPQYETDKNMIFILDESSLHLAAADPSVYIGSEIIKIGKTVENLPDNDLKRISTEIIEGEEKYELISVSYTVVQTDEYGIPNEYEAECEYGRLEDYVESVLESWELTVKYDAYDMEDCIELSTVIYTYECFIPSGIEIQESGSEPEGEAVIMPEDPFIGKIVPAVAIASAGTFLALAFWLFFTTAPLYALTSKGIYRYIGRIRLKKQEGCYEALLTSFLADRAELQNYKIRIPNKIERKSEKKVLLIKCPDQNILSLKLQKEVVFEIEKDNKQ